MRENTILDIINTAKKAADVLYSLDPTGIDKDPHLKDIHFDASKELLITLEEKLTIATHETGSHLGFMLQDIETLLAFIQFRQKYQLLNEEDLGKIIDHQLTMQEQKILINKIVKDKKHWKEGLNYLIQLKADWNKTFSNKSFQKVKEIIAR